MAWKGQWHETVLLDITIHTVQYSLHIVSLYGILTKAAEAALWANLHHSCWIDFLWHWCFSWLLTIYQFFADGHLNIFIITMLNKPADTHVLSYCILIHTKFSIQGYFSPYCVPIFCFCYFVFQSNIHKRDYHLELQN